VMLHLQSRANATMWLRLEPIWKSFGEPFLKQGMAGLSPREGTLKRKGDLEHKYVWRTVNPPKLHALQHARCVISDSFSDSLEKERSLLVDGSLFCSLLFIHWGIEWPKKSTPTSSESGAQIVSRVAQSFQQLVSISLPSSVSYSGPGYKQVPTCGEFIGSSYYDTSLICDLTRYRTPNRVYHEFVIIHSVDDQLHEQWFRIDRVPNVSGPFEPFAAALGQDVAAKDRIEISFDKLLLFLDINDTIRQVAFVTFSGGLGPQPTIGDLRNLLRHIYTIAPQYNLLKENCSFVASVIQEGLTRNFAGKLLAGEKATWSERHAPSTTESIFEEFQYQLGR